MIQTKEVTLGPGDSQEVAFTYTPAEAKTYLAIIDGLSGSFAAATTSSIYGIVTEVDTGLPVEGVAVQVWKPLDGDMAGIFTALTSADGSYSIPRDDVPTGEYSLTFLRLNYDPLRWVPVTVPEIESAECNVEIVGRHAPIVMLGIYVGDYETEAATTWGLKPISGALVEVLYEDGLSTGLSDYTREQGWCTFFDIPGGIYIIRVSSPGYDTEERVVNLGAEAKTSISVMMVPSDIEVVTLIGRVMNIDGEPIPWTDVFVYPTATNQLRIKADPQGYYNARIDVFDNIIELTPGTYSAIYAAPGEQFEIGIKRDIVITYGKNVVDFYLELRT